MAKFKSWRLKKRTSIEIILGEIEALKPSYERLRKIRIHVLREELESRLNHQIGSRYKKKEALISEVDEAIKDFLMETKKPIKERHLAKLLVEEFFATKRICVVLDTLGKSNSILTIANTIGLIIKALK